jgi:hypothetical protein
MKAAEVDVATAIHNLTYSNWTRGELVRPSLYTVVPQWTVPVLSAMAGKVREVLEGRPER